VINGASAVTAFVLDCSMVAQNSENKTNGLRAREGNELLLRNVVTPGTMFY